MGIDTKDKDEAGNAYKEQEDKKSSDDNKKQKNEKKKQKLLQIRGAISIYIIKIIVLMAIATIVKITASDTPALFLGALTFFAAVVLDMAVLTKENPVSDIWYIILIQWFMLIIFFAVAVGDFVLVIIYANSYLSPDVETFFAWAVRICMYIMGSVGPIIEIYYNIPYDD